MELNLQPLWATLPVIIITLLSQETDDRLGPLAELITKLVNKSAALGEILSPYKKLDVFPPPLTEPFETYDFVIVGASPSGAALANRLTEIGKWNVILLEAGGMPNIFTDIPVFAQTPSFTSNCWDSYAEPQEEHCRGCIDHCMKYPKGKGLGGSSIINFMIYTRGNKIDYDKWAAMGNPGWSYEDVLPYFIKAEDSQFAYQDIEYHGRGGYMKVSDANFRTESANAWVESAIQAGHKFVDYNGRSQFGVGFTQTFTRDGKRIQGENAYLRPVRERRNLRVRTGAHVTKVLIKPDTNEAYGVEYVKDGIKYQVYARNEVILSAGSMKTPQILMLSGIGPKDHLLELGIPVVKDLPVGQLMYDHSTALVVTYVLNEGITVVTPRDLIDPATYGNYLLDGRGPLSLSGTVEALTYIKTNVTDPEYPTWPDIELIFSCGSPVTEFGTFLRPLFNIPRETFNLVWKPITGKPAITILAQLMHPRSVGYIRLRSINPFDEPRYFTNFLSDPENKDIRAHVAAIREIQRIVSQPALQRYEPKIIDTPIPGCANFTFDTDEYWECAVRELTASFWHQQATCKMGPKDDKEAVVDARLRVHGINKLRVVDTGIIPRSISAHLTGPAFMIGEKGADIIKQDWGELLVQKTQSEPESKLESKSNSESHLEPELKSESKSHSEPQIEAELESHSESQLGSELKAESKSQPESQLKPELKSHSEPQLRPELEPHSESQLGSELKTESKSQPESQLEPELKSHSDSQLVPELKSHSESQLGPELKSNSESQLEPALEPESKSQSEAQSEPESKSQSEAHMVTENKAPQS